MSSPSKLSALKFFEQMEEQNSPTRAPLAPSSRHNFSPTKKPAGNEDLDALAKQLEITPVSPSKTSALRSRFEQPSATVSSFRSAGSSTASVPGSAPESPRKKHDPFADEQPEWANKNYKDILNMSPKKSPTKPAPRMAPLKAPLVATPPRPQPEAVAAARSAPRPVPASPTRTPRSPAKSVARTSGDGSPGYEYLCRIQALKNWLETVLQETIPQSAAELIPYLRNGIHLAKLANVVLPSKRAVFANDSKLQFRHTENINRFFQLLDYMNVPDLFRFELTDLYDAKNVPKVWFCLHALTYMLNRMNPGYPKADNLVGTLEFSDSDVRAANRALVGAGLPNFASADSDSDDDDDEFVAPPVAPAEVVYRDHEPEVVYVDRQPEVVYLERDVSPRRVMVSSAMQTDPVHGVSQYCDIATSTELKRTESEQSESETRDTRDTRDLNSHDDLDTPSDAHNQNDLTSDSHLPLSSRYKDADDLALDALAPHIVKLQALARGANFRYRFFVDKIMLKSFTDEIEELQSVARGVLSRRCSVHRHRAQLRHLQGSIVGLQSVARRKLVRTTLESPLLDAAASDLARLQAKIRANYVQRYVATTRAQLAKAQPSVVALQSVARQRQVADRYRVFISNSRWLFPLITAFQAQARRSLVTRRPQANVPAAAEAAVTALQSVIRGEAQRYWTHRVRHKLRRHAPAVQELQSIARGGLARTRMCNNVLVNLLYEDGPLNRLYAVARGNRVRREVAATRHQLARVTASSVVPVQTLFRGALARARRDFLLEDVYDQVASVIAVQSAVRGHMVRLAHDSRALYYHNHLAQVVKAQSIIKSWCTQRAYTTLLSTKNPPLAVIRRFAYLLCDSSGDFQQELELSEIRDRILDVSKHNEHLEHQINQLDIKLSLLDKNKITIDDFKNNKTKFKPAVRPTSVVNTQLSRSARARVDFFSTMLYLLQSKPGYFVRLYASGSIAKGSPAAHEVFAAVVALFPIKEASVSTHGREEYFFVKLVAALMEHDIHTSCAQVSDITKHPNTWWIDYFAHINNHTYQRHHLKQMFHKFVSSVVEADHLDFESDPVAIHQGLVDHETKVHGRSERATTVTAAQAIKDPEVSARFVANLMSLRELATVLLARVDQVVDQVPVHVKLVCKRVFQLSQLQFPDKSNHQHLAVAGVVFAKHYLASLLQGPENFGYLMQDPFNPRVVGVRARSNLRQVARVMVQLFSMKPFSDNYLKPLNDYLATTHASVKSVINRLIDVDEIETAYDMTDYDDIITTTRPQLTVGVTTMIALEKLVTEHLDVVCPSPDDQLYQVMAAHAAAEPGDADDYVAFTDMGMVTLTLNPATQEESWADAKANSLFTVAKRCLLYIIRVQDGDNLLELLVSAISPQCELDFRQMVLDDATSPYNKTSLGNLKTLTFHELKKKTLESLLKLENMGLISRKDSFQTVLNQIAIDIKTKNTQRDNRTMQLTIAAKAIAKLTTKETELSRQLADYNRHVESILLHMQRSPKDRKLFNIIPVFSKQYFYHRELRKRNRLPKFGSYKYSAKKLMDQGVLLDYGHLSSSKTDFMFSCHEVGTFTVEAATGSVAIPGALQKVTLDELLNLQYEHEEKLVLFDGMATFHSESLIAMIFRKFYDIKKE
ncbi:ras GTPase-activating-like protein Iqg1p [Diutina catenulata]